MKDNIQDILCKIGLKHSVYWRDIAALTIQEEELHILVYRGSLVRTSVAGKHCDALCQVHEKRFLTFPFPKKMSRFEYIYEREKKKQLSLTEGCEIWQNSLKGSFPVIWWHLLYSMPSLENCISCRKSLAGNKHGRELKNVASVSFLFYFLR